MNARWRKPTTAQTRARWAGDVPRRHLVAIAAVRSSHRTLPLLERTIEKSSQLAVRRIVVLVFALALLASKLGLDLLLGGFAAGLITRQVMQKSEVPLFDSKLTAVAFGVFVPFFFVVSGMQLDVQALFASPSGVLKLVVFFVLFLVVRGTPAMLLYRSVLPIREDRQARALFSATQLPLVVAITTLAVSEGHMRPSTAAALVGREPCRRSRARFTGCTCDASLQRKGRRFAIDEEAPLELCGELT